MDVSRGSIHNVAQRILRIRSCFVKHRYPSRYHLLHVISQRLPMDTLPAVWLESKRGWRTKPLGANPDIYPSAQLAFPEAWPLIPVLPTTRLHLTFKLHLFLLLQGFSRRVIRWLYNMVSWLTQSFAQRRGRHIASWSAEGASLEGGSCKVLIAFAINCFLLLLPRHLNKARTLQQGY
jgi:hypothetical protein